ncbi:CPBP family intramembrane metalloprotease [Flavihumibacter rivuli]|uniref:CPBP family intramembrane glutamic endopeptidase n=1 Tax=Flavihumibacter rivuli TaxID=2838156 RepID=UPI001BDEE746|nr:type II CAAX endopeptidase family protein [Flavihumibacter rivuli]ULQ55707.1 CPBP family intramembrane metalloprotease [Flavihumibacter rivuli]
MSSSLALSKPTKPLLQLAIIAIVIYLPQFLPPGMWLSIGSLVICTLAVFFFAWNDEKSLKRTGVINAGSFLSTLLLGILYGVIFWVLIDWVFTPFIEKLTGQVTDLTRFDKLRGDTKVFARMMLSIWITAAFCEEVVFRGFILERIKVLTGKNWLAILLSAVAFALIHLYQGPSGITITFLAGILFGWLFIRTGYNLWVCIIAHGLVDSLFLFLVYSNLDLKLKALLGW